MSDYIAYKTLVIPAKAIRSADFTKLDTELQTTLRSREGSRQSELVSGDARKVQNAARELVSRYFQVEE